MGSTVTLHNSRPIRISRPTARLDHASFDPSGPALLDRVDPLAPIESPFSPSVSSESGDATSPDLAGLTDRAAVQLAALRGALDEAIRLDSAIGAKSDELARRLEQGVRFERDMDRRLAEAGRSTQILGQAAAALSGLEAVINELRGTQATVEASFRRELDAQQFRIQQQLATHEARIARMIETHTESAAAKLTEHSEAFAARISEISDQARRALDGAQVSAAAAESHAIRISATIERNVKTESDRLAAMLERQGAQVQARVAVVLDEASQRLADIDRDASTAGTAAAEQLERLCERAVDVLGHDPRSASPAAPIPGSLGDLVARAEAAASAADEAVVRISVATDRANLATEVEDRVAILRDECESMAASVRFNLAQVQQSEAILGKTIDRARDRVQSLENAMDQVTEQAGSMVQVARDVASLVLRAEQAKGELAASVENAADPEQTSPAAGRIRRAPFGPPQAQLDNDSAAAA